MLVDMGAIYFYTAPWNYFDPLIDLPGGRRDLHSTQLSVLISSSGFL